MQGDNESLQNGVSHKPQENKSDHKKYETQKRVVVVEITKFMLKKDIDKPIIKYLNRLRNASKYCEFE